MKENFSQQLSLVQSKVAAGIKRLDAHDRVFATKSITDALSGQINDIANKPR